MTETENKTKVKNRAWVKNAAIVFLAVLLVLTFFSNTFMNYSLPVVSAQYPMSGTISAKIRGQGTVASNQSYNVTVDETREIKTVAVKRGDTVQAGQVLFILDDKESTELTVALAELSKLEYDYQIFLLGLAASSPEVTAAQNALTDAITAQGKAGTEQSTANTDLNTAKADLDKAQKEYDAAKIVLDAAQAAYDLADTAKSNADLTLSQAQAAQTLAEGELTEEEEKLRGPLTQAEKDLEAANLAAANAKTNLDYYEGVYGSYSAAQTKMDAAQTAMDGYSDEISALEKQKRDVQNSADYNKSKHDQTLEEIASLTGLLTDYNSELDYLYENNEDVARQKELRGLIASATTQLAKAQTTASAYEAAVADIKSLDTQITTLEAKYRAAEIEYDDAKAVTKNSSISSAMSEYEDALEWVTTATNNVYTEQTKYNNLSPSKNAEVDAAKKAVTQAQTDATKKEIELKAANTTLTQATSKFTPLDTKLTEAKAKKEAAESAISKDLDSYAQAVRDARQNLETALENVETTGAKNDLDLQKQKDDIAKKQEEVEKLTTEASPVEITAKFGGVLTALNVTAGDKTEYGATMATIEVVDKGYTLELSVDSEQAAKVTIGDKAEITNLWGNDTTATLAQVVTDPDSAGKKKILRFIIEGDNVSTGQTLSLSIGQRSQNYDAIVPNSAIREDSNGKYIYTVETKSSPLSNRYVATRLDITVLASDDTNSAISGTSGGEFVIVTSTAPLTAGQLIRTEA